MKKIMILIALLCLIPAIAAADCVTISGGEKISKDTLLCSQTYDIDEGIEIIADNIEIDCGSARLEGKNVGSGIRIKSREGIAITNCNILYFEN